MSSATCISEAASNPINQATAAKIAGNGAKPARVLRRAMNSRNPRKGLIVIDCLNVFFASNFDPRLENVLALFGDVIANGYDVAGIFDSTARFKIADWQDGNHVDAYFELLRKYPSFFVETTGGTSADEMLLSLAEMNNAPIVSNDQYRDWEEDFDFLNRAEIIKVNAWRDVLFVGNQRLRVDADLRTAMAKVENVVASHLN